MKEKCLNNPLNRIYKALPVATDEPQNDALDVDPRPRGTCSGSITGD